MSGLGNVYGCETPQKVFNKYTNEFLYVSCRRCTSCLNKRSLDWIERIDKECKLHRYSVFFTLTYDNEHLPYYSLMWNDEKGCDQMISNRLCDFDRVLPQCFNDKVISVTHFDKQCVPYPCRNDVKLFWKRLRSRIDYEFRKNGLENAERKIRYFIASEYGPRTLRPHYHGICWIDSEYTFRCFEKFLSESWQNGNVDYSIVNGSAAQYVAKYVNGNTSLPAVLCSEYTRTFSLKSKNPSIGYSSSDEEKIQEQFLEESYGGFELDVDTMSPVYVQPPCTLESKYFPKCVGYSRISRFEKLRVYSIAYDFIARRRESGLDYDNRELSDYLNSVFDSAVDLHCAYACNRWCCKTGLTPEIYLYKLDKYYSNKQLYLLKLMYEYQHEYVDGLGLPLHHLLDFDMTVFDRLPPTVDWFDYDSEQNTKLKYIFASYGVDVRSLYCEDGNLDQRKVMYLHQWTSTFWSNNVRKQWKLAQDANKYKKLNEQLDSFHLFGEIDCKCKECN